MTVNTVNLYVVAMGGNPDSLFTVSGKTSTVTGNITLTSSYNNVLCDSTTSMTVTLPPCSTVSGKQFLIKNINIGLVTVDGYSSETIEGNLTMSLSLYDSLSIVNNGSNWFIIG
jgi:hypothetical protein